ncbi:hypothetical protein [Maricaulis maris]|uniref:hypothetical protein n=1 Tax=Maricaulis maris TaxID=74318 RepID=UPI003B8C277F
MTSRPIRSGSDPYELSAEEVAALDTMLSLPSAERAGYLTRALGSAEAGLDALIQFTLVAQSVVENNREAIEMIRITEMHTHPHRADQINLPTLRGALRGLTLSNDCSSPARCDGCAFRTGTLANQSEITTLDADHCSDLGGETFYCHEELDEDGKPVKACAGYAERLKRSIEADPCGGC